MNAFIDAIVIHVALKSS